MAENWVPESSKSVAIDFATIDSPSQTASSHHVYFSLTEFTLAFQLLLNLFKVLRKQNAFSFNIKKKKTLSETVGVWEPQNDLVCLLLFPLRSHIRGSLEACAGIVTTGHSISAQGLHRFLFCFTHALLKHSPRHCWCIACGCILTRTGWVTVTDTDSQSLACAHWSFTQKDQGFSASASSFSTLPTCIFQGTWISF